MTEMDHPEVATPFGRLRGVRRDGVTAFRRVPYAAPPTGARRFEMPVEAARWHGIRDAIRQGPIPPQLPSRLDAVTGAYAVEQSEDCLHLDIWTGHNQGARAPVLVFIHGGAFMTGGGSLPCYDGGLIAKENGLVVVNITYRLGILGFWPQPDFGGMNLGLHDQVVALRWIRSTIDCFGGDPERITVVGQSAGAFSIAAFLGTDVAKGLFSRAILMSAPLGISLRSVEKARPVAAALLDVLQIQPQQVDTLRTMPLSRIFERLPILQRTPPAIAGDITPPFMPVLDGSLLPRDPISSIKAGSAKWCDVVIGATREEYAAFSISNPNLDQLTEPELSDLFRIEVGNDAVAVMERIRSTRVPSTPRTLLGDLRSELIFINDSLAAADVQSKFGREAFMYLFDWQSPVPGMGACHCIDLPFLFGNVDVWKAAPMLNGADWREVQELSRLFRGSLAAFAAKGDPGGKTLPRWPAYKQDQAVLHIDRRITVSRMDVA